MELKEQQEEEEKQNASSIAAVFFYFPIFKYLWKLGNFLALGCYQTTICAGSLFFFLCRKLRNEVFLHQFNIKLS